MLSFFACMPSIKGLPCALQPDMWPLIGYGALIIVGVIMMVIAVIIIKKQEKKVKKG